MDSVSASSAVGFIHYTIHIYHMYNLIRYIMIIFYDISDN